MRQIVSSAAMVACAALWPACEAWAWGSPHSGITRAALAAQPELPRWRQELGAENLEILTAHSNLPDRQGEDVGTFHADDYLLTRQVPVYPGHRVPFVFTRPYPPKDFKPLKVALEKGASEVRQKTGNGYSLLYVSVKSPRPLGEVIERVWAVKE